MQGIGPVGTRTVENNPPVKELWTADFRHLIGMELQVIFLYQSRAYSKSDTKKEQIIIISYSIFFFIQGNEKKTVCHIPKITRLLQKPCLALRAGVNQHRFFYFSGFAQADPVLLWRLERDITSCLFLGKLRVGSSAFEKLALCGGMMLLQTLNLQGFYIFFPPSFNKKQEEDFLTLWTIPGFEYATWHVCKQEEKALTRNFLNCRGWRTANGMQAREHDN